MANQNTLFDLSVTPANNLNIKGQSQQGTAPGSTIDNIFQRYGAALKAFYDSFGGAQTAGGTATALTLTVTEDWAALAHGLRLSCKAPSAATGASTLVVTVPTAGALPSNKIRRQGDSAIQANDWLANAHLDLEFDSTYDSSNGAWVLMNPAASSTVTDISSQLVTPINLSFAASVGSSALTIALKGVDGNDPSSTNKVIIPFRNVTAATGTLSYLTITAATSIVISSGSTMGFTSAVAGRLWIVGFNDGGTFRLGLVNALSGTSIMALRHGIYSSTAEGGAGAADSAQVIYTGTAVTSKAMTVLGYLEWTSGLGTAGTWSAAPDIIKIWQPGDPLPGDTLQIRRTDTGAVATGTTTVPVDDTIPQNTEGDQYMSQAITPTAAANILRITARGQFVSSTASALAWTMSVFQDSTAGALKTSYSDTPSGVGVQLDLQHQMLAGTSSSTTMKIRAGCHAAGTTTFNGNAGSRRYGGAINSFVEVIEVMA